jgi:hypothetical protein
MHSIACFFGLVFLRHLAQLAMVGKLGVPANP